MGHGHRRAGLEPVGALVATLRSADGRSGLGGIDHRQRACHGPLAADENARPTRRQGAARGPDTGSKCAGALAARQPIGQQRRCGRRSADRGEPGVVLAGAVQGHATDRIRATRPQGNDALTPARTAWRHQGLAARVDRCAAGAPRHCTGHSRAGRVGGVCIGPERAHRRHADRARRHVRSARCEGCAQGHVGRLARRTAAQHAPAAQHPRRGRRSAMGRRPGAHHRAAGQGHLAWRSAALEPHRVAGAVRQPAGADRRASRARAGSHRAAARPRSTGVRLGRRSHRRRPPRHQECTKLQCRHRSRTASRRSRSDGRDRQDAGARPHRHAHWPGRA